MISKSHKGKSKKNIFGISILALSFIGCNAFAQESQGNSYVPINGKIIEGTTAFLTFCDRSPKDCMADISKSENEIRREVTVRLTQKLMTNNAVSEIAPAKTKRKISKNKNSKSKKTHIEYENINSMYSVPVVMSNELNNQFPVVVNVNNTQPTQPSVVITLSSDIPPDVLQRTLEACGNYCVKEIKYTSIEASPILNAAETSSPQNEIAKPIEVAPGNKVNLEYLNQEVRSSYDLYQLPANDISNQNSFVPIKIGINQSGINNNYTESDFQNSLKPTYSPIKNNENTIAKPVDHSVSNYYAPQPLQAAENTQLPESTSLGIDNNINASPKFQQSISTDANNEFMTILDKNTSHPAPEGLMVAWDNMSLETAKYVNDKVNRSIISTSDMTQFGKNDYWFVPENDGSRHGDCEDYALQKRAEFIKLGYPPQALSLAIVETPRREDHAVLVLHTVSGDFILDNLTNKIKLWNKSGYKFIAIQSRGNPLDWVSINGEML